MSEDGHSTAVVWCSIGIQCVCSLVRPSRCCHRSWLRNSVLKFTTFLKAVDGLHGLDDDEDATEMLGCFAADGGAEGPTQPERERTRSPGRTAPSPERGDALGWRSVQLATLRVDGRWTVHATAARFGARSGRRRDEGEVPRRCQAAASH